MDTQTAVVLDEPELAELVHEKAYSRAGSTDHIGQGLLADFRYQRLRFPLLPEIGQQQKNPRQALFARIEKLIDKVFFNTNVARQQM